MSTTLAYLATSASILCGNILILHIMDTKLMILAPAALAALGCAQQKEQLVRPNILFIVADDLGMGDVSAYGSRTISTPNIDSLASHGVRFDNVYATSATSTPSRYAMFTGLYPWKNPDAKILPGDAPLLIPVDIPTLPKMMQKAGYSTAAIGKWHLGMGNGNVDWNREVVPSANTVGFDYTCLIAATNDRVPTVYVENGLVEGLDPADPIYVSYEKNFEGEPTAITNPELMKMEWDHGHNCSVINGIPRIGYMKGGRKARWVDEDMADYFVDKVKAYIDGHSGEPFFLYYGLHQPHVPRAPHSRFVGSTTLGPRGDAVVEADWCVSEVIACLEKKGLLENTLVIFTSDNGPVVNDGYKDGAVEMLGEHDPMNGLRGGKYSLFDGGTHVPFIVYWKGRIVPGVSEAFFSQLDMFASIAALFGLEAPDGLDSQAYPEVLTGRSDKGRRNLVLEAQGKLAYKSGDYVMIPPYKGAKRNITGNEIGNMDDYVLYDLKSDRGQRHDLSKEQPEVLDSLKKEFHSKVGDYYVADKADAVLK